MDQELSPLPLPAEPSEELKEPLLKEKEEHLREQPEHDEGEHRPVLPQEFLAQIERLGTPEEKLDRAVAFMQEILEGGGPHQFREFWEARRLCLELFQTPIHPTVRVRLWTRYSELCREARRLKELFEEQSSFITEQVEKAIDAIEEDFSTLDAKLATMPEIEALRGCKSIVNHFGQYQTLQHELNYLNSFASRITALRKEVLKTEIRHKQKARLLERLRVLGDWIYPRRKQAIHDVSELFLADVAAFIQLTFVGELKTHELFDAREEIKTLQGVGKLLTLSTDAFTKTRLQLSECWDSIKTVLKEKKKAQSEQRQTFRQHKDEIFAAIDTAKSAIEGDTLKGDDAWKELRKIDSHMNSLSLGHHDVRAAREKLRELGALVDQKRGGLEKETPRVRAEHKSPANELRSRGEAVLEMAAGLTDIEGAFLTLQQDAATRALSKSERIELDRVFSKIQRKIAGLRHERLPSLTSEEAIEEELAVLEDMRVEIKHQLEVWRKASGGFGCDFSEGLRYQELAEDARGRLEGIEVMIEELEGRLEAENTESSQ